MERNCVVLRKRLTGVEVCYNLQGEILMAYRTAISLSNKLTKVFPGNTYVVFKEVKNKAKKGVSFIKNPGTTNS